MNRYGPILIVIFRYFFACIAGRVKFFLEFTERSKFLIKTEAGAYLEGEQNGGYVLAEQGGRGFCPGGFTKRV